MNAVEVVVTGPAEWMEECVAHLLEDRLIACAQTWPIYSRYWWHESIDDANETRAAMHAPLLGVDSLIANIEKRHPYEVPCVVVSPLQDGSPSYIQWIHENTRGEGSEALNEGRSQS